MIFAELIMALFGVPVNFTAAIQHGWKLGETWCHAHGFFLTLESKYQFSTLLSYSTENIEIRGIQPFFNFCVELI